MICWPNVGLMLAYRLRRWPNNNPTLGQRFVFAGNLAVNSHSSDILIDSDTLYRSSDSDQVPKYSNKTLKVSGHLLL